MAVRILVHKYIINQGIWVEKWFKKQCNHLTFQSITVVENINIYTFKKTINLYVLKKIK